MEAPPSLRQRGPCGWQYGWHVAGVWLAVNAMTRWLKDASHHASRTAALGQERPVAKLLGVVVTRWRGSFL